MDTLEHQAQKPARPTPDRPLLGLTALVIEAAALPAKRMRLLWLAIGAGISGRQSTRARRHLQVLFAVYRVADLGLPDETALI